MDRDQLRTFDQVVQTGTFSQAAWALDITQPSVSSRIAALEQEVGGPLFVRGGRRVGLTELGRSFLPYARRVLEVLNEGLEMARLTQQGRCGRLVVGTLISLADGLVAPAIGRFYAEHPMVEITVRADDSNAVARMLHDRVVELGVVAWPCDDPLLTDLRPLLFFREPLVLVAHPHHELARRGPVTLEEVGRLAQPYLDSFPLPSAVLNQLTAGTTLDLPFPVARRLLQGGLGASVMTRTLVSDDLECGRLTQIEVLDLPTLWRESALVYHPGNGAVAAVAREFTELLAEAGGGLLVSRPAAAALSPDPA
ncbi:LysR family transcriptional regulator [Deinococcus sp.]|uniref:LysR family transcriptional regulator n=1 Tax=Deinococcus sp. TaxID=47478 RepID=UPI003C7B1C84